MAIQIPENATDIAPMTVTQIPATENATIIDNDTVEYFPYVRSPSHIPYARHH